MRQLRGSSKGALRTFANDILDGSADIGAVAILENIVNWRLFQLEK
jgi:hypothetical protein